MSRSTYIMKTEEVQMLITGIISNGPEDTYNKMRSKAFISMNKKNDIDEMFLDMSESLSNRAKEEIDTSGDDDSSLSNIYSSLAFMLRQIAHEVYRKYIKRGEERDNNRFLRLVSHNKDISLMI